MQVEVNLFLFPKTREENAIICSDNSMGGTPFFLTLWEIHKTAKVLVWFFSFFMELIVG